SSERYGTGQFQGVYVLSHSIDNSEDPLVPQEGAGGRTFPRDSSGFKGGFGTDERGNSGFDTRNRFVGNFVYELPFKSSNKRFTFKERHVVSIRADFFNMFNRVNLDEPNNSIGDPNFGQSLAAGSPRIIQFAVRYNF